MAEKDVVTYPNDILHRQAKTVTKIDAKTKKLVDEMVKMMKEENGVGLAANQIGVLQKVFVYDDGDVHGALINAKITSRSGEQTAIEGCLSVPGLQGDVTRAQEIVVKGLDQNGKEVKIKADGLLARIFQHEMDHLDGKLFIDRVEPGSLHYVTDEDDDEEEEEVVRE